VRGGGDLTVRAGGDIQGGLFVLGRGQARLRAAGSLLPGAASAYLQGGRLHRPIGALLGLMDATASLTAGGDVSVEGVFDPMLQAQVGANLQGPSATGAAFWGFTDRTALEVTALSGDVQLQSDPWASQDLASALNGARLADRVTPTPATSSLGTWFARSPGTLRLAALEGSVVIQDAASTASGLTLASAHDGQLELLARQDVVLALKKVAMDEILPGYRRDATASFATTANAATELVASTSQWRSDGSTNQLRGFGAPLHADDPAPARIYALDGSICAYQSGACAPDTTTLLNPTTISLPKALDAYAGTDLLAGAWSVQHDGPLDTTVLRAGRDVYDAALTVSGDGLAVVEAGRDVRLHLQGNVTPPPVTGTRGGLLQSVGNARNPALPAGRAASLEVLAGANGLDLATFEAVYLDPTNARAVPATYLDALRGYLQALGLDAPADPAALRAALDALPQARRRAFLLDAVLFPELQASGQEYNDPASRRFHSYDRGLAALGLLSPAPDDPALHGDIILNGKPVETQALAGLTLLAPHGRIAVGSEAVDTSSGGGVVTRRGGDIHLLAQGNVDLYTSRVFTLQGGNILIWSNGGSITAGAGAKTAVRDVPLQYTMSTDGVVTLDVFGLQTGAGIGVLDALQGGDSPATRSRLDLIAPTGEVNAGDAGIRSVGDLNIAAQVVVGSENIQVGGKASGVPHVEAPSVGALTTASQLKTSAATEGVGPDPQAAQRTLAQLPSIITVEVIGYDVIEDDQTLPRKKKKGADEPRK
jgi:filamentous hemagglutinin